MTPDRARWTGLAILSAFALLCVVQSRRIRPGHAPDEPAHVYYVRKMAATGWIPDWKWPGVRLSYQAHQAPLYYHSASLVVRLLDASPPPVQFAAMRLVSGGFHVAALAFIWALARTVCAGPASALGPLALAAGIPMFAFIGATVTNDPAANAAGAALLWLCAASAPLKRPPAGAVGLLAGLALLSKANVWPLCAVCVLSLRRAGDPRASAGRIASAASWAAAVAGWFYLFNTLRLGDPVGAARLRAYDPGHVPAAWWFPALRVWFESFWGMFGWMRVSMEPSGLAAALALCAAAVAGWLARWRTLVRRPARPLLLWAAGLTLAQNFVWGFLFSSVPQARHSFPALAALAVLMWDGLSALFERRSAPTRRAALAAFAALLLTLQWAAWPRMP